MQRFTVTGKEVGWRFDKYLKKLLPQAANGFLYKMLRKKNITLNGKKAAGNEAVAAGDTVEMFFSEETFLKFSGKSVAGQTQRQEDSRGFSETGFGQGERVRKSPEKGAGKRAEQSFSVGAARAWENAYRRLSDISVIYEDGDILVLNKPVGVLSQKAEKDDISLNEWMLGYLMEKGEMSKEEAGNFRPSVCNRLDRNTSGLVLCGKSARGSRFLSEMLRERNLRKYYTAYVQGKIEREIALDGYLKKEEEKNRSRILSEKEYRRLATAWPEVEKENRRLATARPETEKEDRRLATAWPETEKEDIPALENMGQSNGITSERDSGAKQNMAHMRARGYQKIETVIKPLFYEKKRDCSKLEILLVTGKSHQIRAHLASIGHPVLGDWKYGFKPRNKGEEMWKYQMLHAGRIEFPQIEGEFARLSGRRFEAREPEF